MDILEKETKDNSYKSHKYSLEDSERSTVEYHETKEIKTYVSLTELSRQVGGEQDFIGIGGRHQ
jgi:hypothetical protein